MEEMRNDDMMEQETNDYDSGTEESNGDSGLVKVVIGTGLAVGAIGYAADRFVIPTVVKGGKKIGSGCKKFFGAVKSAFKKDDKEEEESEEKDEKEEQKDQKEPEKKSKKKKK